MPMAPKERERFLSGVGVFASCKRRDLGTLARSCEERHFDPGDVLCRQGERGVAMFVVVSGSVRIEETMEDGRCVVVGKLGPGSTVGEMAIIDGAERTASVVADEPTDVLVLTMWDFRAILRRRPAIAHDVLLVVVRRFRETAARLRRTIGTTDGLP